jgi:hypothetical protein
VTAELGPYQPRSAPTNSASLAWTPPHLEMLRSPGSEVKCSTRSRDLGTIADVFRSATERWLLAYSQKQPRFGCTKRSKGSDKHE